MISKAVLLITWMMLLAFCTGPSERTVRGLVIEVEARSIASASTVAVQTEDGRSLRFQVADSVNVTPGHLRQHQVFREPVTVTYRDTPQGLVATAIDD